jgi:NAD(P)-dependent dehydrogenase (short-subunit alcohol dehydrogenase family)
LRRFGQTTYPAFGLYHAMKWGIEGLVETLAKEVGPFGIDCVIVEPGPTATSFGANVDRSVPLAAYDATPAADLRRVITSGSFRCQRRCAAHCRGHDRRR